MLIFIAGFPATAHYDPSSTFSSISQRFLSSNACSSPEAETSLSLSMQLPEGPFTCELRFHIVESLPYHAVLGRDWNQLLRSAGHFLSGTDDVRVLSSEAPLQMPCALPSACSATAPSSIHHCAASASPCLSESSSGTPSGEGFAPNEVLVEDFYKSFDISEAANFKRLKHNLLSKNTSHSRISVFDPDATKIQHLMSLHGLTPCPDLRTSRQILIHHLLTGACMEFAHEPAPTYLRPRRVVCRLITPEFESAYQLSARMLRTVADGSIKARDFPTDHLCLIAQALDIPFTYANKNLRRDIQNKLQDKAAALDSLVSGNASVADVFNGFETRSKPALRAFCDLHQIPLPSPSTTENLRSAIVEHLAQGSCATGNSSSPGCSAFKAEWKHTVPASDWDLFFLKSVVHNISLRPLRRLLETRGIPYCPTDNLNQTRKVLKQMIRSAERGKTKDPIRQHDEDIADVRKNWPKVPPQSLKDKLINLFRNETSSEALATATCAACSETILKSERKLVSTAAIDLSLLKRPDARIDETGYLPDDMWLDNECEVPMPLADNSNFVNVLLDPAGIDSTSADADGHVNLILCRRCTSDLKSNRVPALSLANRTYLGDVPPELTGLTVVEEAMISRCRAKCLIVQLKEENTNVTLPNAQRGLHGHIIVYPQNPSAIAESLPPALDEITSPICVLFVGAQPPTQEWLRENAKPLAVRPAVVRRALKWLKAHNRLYKDIQINEDVLMRMDDYYIPPFQVEHILPSEGADARTSRYDASAPLTEDVPLSAETTTSIPWQNVVITDVDGSAPANELRAAAFRHVKNHGGAYVSIPHDPDPVNEFDNPSLFPLIYPTLFPYGIGGFNDSRRENPLSMERHIKHLFNLRDRRFQEHYSFLFTAFNMLQRHAALLHTKLKTKKANFESMASEWATVSPETIHTVVERMSRGETNTTGWSPEEQKAFKLMRQVTAVTAQVPGSAAARISMRNEIRGLMIDKGLPSFYVTINPADVFNPLVKFLAGNEIDIDNLLPEHVPDYWQQSILVARNPAVAAKFFNIYMKAFLSCLLKYDPKGMDTEGGILGVAKAYYGCVEAQGRGTLHCHMLIWLEGGLNPNEIRDRVLRDPEFQARLLAYLDDAISNSVIPDPDPSLEVQSTHHHPCSVRGVPLKEDGPLETVTKSRLKDMHHLSTQCQTHSHSKTCYKYWKGPPEPKECRFDKHPENYRSKSTVDEETGELHLRCLDGMVNNFNATILEAVRCNMDIQFIGSGTSAKAILYYVTDYITKSQLKTHVAYAALERAVKKLSEFDPEEDDISTRAKKMLQKCAYALISHQELSAQQVVSYLLDLEDHFTSHKYSQLYWTSFERSIDNEDPSPECNSTQAARSNVSEPDPDCDVDGPANALDDDLTDGQCPDDHIPVEQIVEDDPEEEIPISFDQHGNMIASDANIVLDYRYRGNELDGICVWDYISRIKKITMRRNRKTKEQRKEEDSDYDSEEIDNEDVDECEIRQTQSSKETPFTSTKRCRPRVKLLAEHKQSKTHILYVNHPSQRTVPVPIGPGLPRQDREETRVRYERLMLILFKPWRTAKDLRNVGQSWTEAFAEFSQACPSEYRQKMANIQVLHECRDSRDDHFASRRGRATQRIHLGGTDRFTQDDDLIGDNDSQRAVLEHLLDVKACSSNKIADENIHVMQCLEYAKASGMFHPVPSNQRQESGDCMGIVTDVQLIEDELLELHWEKDYDERRSAWKKRVDTNVAVSNGQSSSNIVQNSAILDDGTLLRSAFDHEGSVAMRPEIRQDIQGNAPAPNIDIAAGIQKWTLNREQRRAFQIIAEHSLLPRPDPLRMFLGGAGGTGKSRVIDALKDYFTLCGQSRRLRLASYTGVAARNIQGMTLHSALSLSQRMQKGGKGRTNRDLIATWDGVDYLFVDEISMVGCSLLYDISEALSEAKSSSTPFGGINVIFAGDFAQLPPVLETKLYAHIKCTTNSTVQAEKKIFGKLLWLGVDTVVMLHENVRQSGSQNAEFVQLLSRLRRGNCTQADYNLLQSRLVTVAKPDWSDPLLQRAPIIVAQNAIKDKLNEMRAKAFAAHTGQELHWYYASDRRQGKPITDPDLKKHLYELPTGQTNQRLGRIPLVVGMPVMITQNFDVENGVVNGSIGVLRKIRYYLDGEGNRHAKSCIVEVPDMSGPSLHDLPPKHAVALEDSVNMTFTHPHSKRKCTITRVQVPIVPAFAMTAHKAQGQTLEKVIVDLEACRGTEGPYVMLSRAKSLEGLFILRPFSQKRITTHPSQESRQEFARLDILRLQTLIRHGDAVEQAEARAALARKQITISCFNETNESNDSPRRLHRLQNQIERETTRWLHGNGRIPSNRKRQLSETSFADTAEQNERTNRRVRWKRQ